MEICYHLEPWGGGGGVGVEVWSWSLRGSKQTGFLPGESCYLSGKPLDPPAIRRREGEGGGFRKETGCFNWSTTMADVYCILFGRECLSMKGGGWGGGVQQWKLYACQCGFFFHFLLFLLPSKWQGRTLSLLSILCEGKAELMASEHWSAFWKQTGMLFVFFLMLILTDVLFRVLC